MQKMERGREKGERIANGKRQESRSIDAMPIERQLPDPGQKERERERERVRKDTHKWD